MISVLPKFAHIFFGLTCQLTDKQMRSKQQNSTTAISSGDNNGVSGENTARAKLT